MNDQLVVHGSWHTQQRRSQDMQLLKLLISWYEDDDQGLTKLRFDSWLGRWVLPQTILFNIKNVKIITLIKWCK